MGSNRSRISRTPRVALAVSVVAMVVIGVGMAPAAAIAVPAAPVRASLASALDPALDPVTSAHALRIVDKYAGEWTTPPAVDIQALMTDAPLLGNGDVGVVLGGQAQNLTAYVSKGDFWLGRPDLHQNDRKGADFLMLGRVQYSIPGFTGASYRMVQDLRNAEVRGSFGKDGQSLETTSRVDANNNVVITSFTLTGGTGAQNVEIGILNGDGAAPAFDPVMNTGNDVMSVDLPAKTSGGDLDPDVLDPVARISTKVVGAAASLVNEKFAFTMQPGNTYTVVSAIVSNNDTPATAQTRAYQATATTQAEALTQGVVNTMGTAHRSWWTEYWSRSFVEIPDKAIEKVWYGSQYIMGSASRSGKPAPGLWGLWNTSKQMQWGDYHLNYNYQIPFLGPIATNHVDMADSYAQPVLDFMDEAKRWALEGDPQPRNQEPALFRAGNEDGEPDPDWTGAAQVELVANVNSALFEPVAGSAHYIEGHDEHSGAFRYSGTAVNSGPSDRVAYNRIFDLTDEDVTVGPRTTLSYWVYPEGATPTNGVSGNNSACVGIDVVFDSGPPLRGSAAFDTAGRNAHAAEYCGTLKLNAWNRVTVNLGATNLGKKIDRLLFAYHQVNGVGGYRGYVDDISINNGRPGLLYPVGIGPHGTKTDPLGTLGQKSNAAYAAAPMITQFYATYDEDYANGVYDYLKEAALFWEDFLIKEATTGTEYQYSIVGEGVYEGDGGGARNPTATLAMVKYLFQGLVDISETLDQDAGARAAWIDIRDNLAPFPIGQYDPPGAEGPKPVLDEKEGANRVDQGDNDVVGHAVYPFGQIGLDSDEDQLTAAKNYVDELTSWHGRNAPATLYAIAARIGYEDEARLMNELHTEATTYTYKNLAVAHGNGGGIENTNVVVSGLAEMMLQSHQDDLKLFPAWPVDTDAKFGDQRVKGAFLVSSSIKDDQVQYIRVVSEKGRDLKITNPWSGDVVVYRDDVATTITDAMEFTLETDAGETLYIAPAGTTLATINTQLAAFNAQEPDPPVSSATNLALGTPASQSSSPYPAPQAGAAKAVDGNTDGDFYHDSVSLTGNTDAQTWWKTDLGGSLPIGSIAVHNRSDASQSLLSDYWVFVSDTPFSTALAPAAQATAPGVVWSVHKTTQAGNPTTIPVDQIGRYVMIQLNTPGYLSLAEVQVYPANIAKDTAASQSSSPYPAPQAGAAKAVDGNTDGDFYHDSVSLTGNTDAQTWWKTDLGSSLPIGSILVHNRTDAWQNQLSDYWVFVSDAPFTTPMSPTAHANTPGVWSVHKTTQAGNPTAIPVGASGRYVMIQLNTPGYLQLAEVEVYQTRI